MSDPARYDTVADTLRESVKPHRPDSVAACPPINRRQAQRVAELIVEKFWPRQLMKAGPGIVYSRSDPRWVRRVWISRLPTASSNSAKGLGRLVHDLSHDIFEAVYPNRRPHDPLHVKYENDVALFVGSSVRIASILWPELKPKAPKPTATELRSRKLASTVESIKRWESKAKRAATALRKLRARERGLERAMYEHDMRPLTRNGRPTWN